MQLAILADTNLPAYNMLFLHFFHEKHCQNCGGEISSEISVIHAHLYDYHDIKRNLQIALRYFPRVWILDRAETSCLSLGYRVMPQILNNINKTTTFEAFQCLG